MFGTELLPEGNIILRKQEISEVQPTWVRSFPPTPTPHWLCPSPDFLATERIEVFAHQRNDTNCYGTFSCSDVLLQRLRHAKRQSRPLPPIKLEIAN